METAVPEVSSPSPEEEEEVETTLSTGPVQVQIVGSNGEEWLYDEEYGVEVYGLNPVTDASGLKGVLLDILGDYDAIVVEHRYLNSNGTSYSYVREIQPDFPWLCSAAIFLALLWSVFAIGGRMICRK